MAKKKDEMEYKWGAGPKPKVDAQTFGEEVERIAKQKHREFRAIKSEDVVEAAKNPKSPIHQLFPFDDLLSSAEAHWNELARSYIRQLQIVPVVVRHDGAESERAYYSAYDRNGKRAYMPISAVMSEESLRRSVIEEARKGLLTYVSRFKGSIGNFGAYIHDLETIIERMKDEIDALTQEALRRRGKGSSAEVRGDGPDPGSPPA